MQELCTNMHEHACVCVLKCVYMYTCTFFINRILRKCSSPKGHVEICQLLFYPNQIIWVSFDFASNIQIYKHQNGSLEEVRPQWYTHTPVHLKYFCSSSITTKTITEWNFGLLASIIKCTDIEGLVKGSWSWLCGLACVHRACLGELSFKGLFSTYSEFLVTCFQIGTW